MTKQVTAEATLTLSQNPWKPDTYGMGPYRFRLFGERIEGQMRLVTL